MRRASTEIRTERLLLNSLGENDAGLMLSVWNDPTFIRYVGDRGVRTLDEARKVLRDGALKMWEELGYGPYRVAEKNSGEAAGICGLFKRDNLDHPDIGYGLLPPFRGKGYAFEAARAVMQHARDAMGLSCVKAIVSQENARSVQLLEKLGMTPEGPIRMPGEDEDVMLYGIRFEDKT